MRVCASSLKSNKVVRLGVCARRSTVCSCVIEAFIAGRNIQLKLKLQFQREKNRRQQQQQQPQPDHFFVCLRTRIRTQLIAVVVLIPCVCVPIIASLVNLNWPFKSIFFSLSRNAQLTNRLQFLCSIESSSSFRCMLRLVNVVSVAAAAAAVKWQVFDKLHRVLVFFFLHCFRVCLQ